MPHLEAASILLVGPTLKKFNDRGMLVYLTFFTLVFMRMRFSQSHCMLFPALIMCALSNFLPSNLVFTMKCSDRSLSRGASNC